MLSRLGRFTRASTPDVPSRRSLLQLISPFVEGQRKRLLAVCLTAVVGGFAEAGALVLLARIAFALSSDTSNVEVDLGPLGTTHVSVPGLIWLAAGLLVVRVLLQVTQARIGATLGASVLERTRRRILEHYLAANWALQSSQRDGRLQELMTTFVNQAASAASTIGLGAVAAFNLLAFVSIAFLVNVVASFLIAVFAFALALLLRPLRAAVRRRAARQAAANLTLATGVTEFAQSLQEVRIYGVTREVGDRIDQLNRHAAALNRRRYTLANTIPALYQGLALLLIVGALGLAYAVSFSDLASIGAVVLIMLRSLGYGQSLQGCVQSLHEEAPYLEELIEEEDRYVNASVQSGSRPVDRVGAITFEGVSFAYRPGEVVLRDVGFTLKSGEIVGIVGPSGSGKSTLVQLLLRLREPSFGRILVDGVDAAEFEIDDWYNHVTFVPQEPRLFSGTVEQNIRFYRSDVEDSRIERAARLAHIHDDIMSWPKGYDTHIGERGNELSGGQRQRVCIARALVDEPDVVVLDEPTSALDVRSESLLRQTIADLAPARTVVVIAHRISTLSICDRIMVVMKGEIQGFDTPEQLEASGGFYKEALQISGMRG